MASTVTEEKEVQVQSTMENEAALAGTVLDPETIREFIQRLEQRS